MKEIYRVAMNPTLRLICCNMLIGRGFINKVHVKMWWGQDA